MKIAFATSSFRGGGITSYAIEFIKAFKDVHELSVLIGDDSKAPIEYPNVKVYRCESLDLSVDNAKKALHLISDTISPDILFISNSRVVSLIIPFLPDGLRVITISHSQKYIEADVAAFQSCYLDKIVTLSSFSEESIKKRFHLKQSNKFITIPNFVHSVHNAKEIMENKISSNQVQILFMGGSSGSKSPDIVLKIMAELKKTDLDFKFYWLGNDSPPLRRFLSYDHISELFKNDPRFIFTGRIPRKEALSICNTTNVILMPSRREGCPMALLEAMRTGVITITSDYNTSCKEMVVPGETGLIINHNDIKLFVSSITDIVNNRDAYNNYYQSSFDFFVINYSFDIWCLRMNKLFLEEMLTHRNRFKRFSSIRYFYDKLRLVCLDKINYVVQLFEETIYPSLAFFATKVY